MRRTLSVAAFCSAIGGTCGTAAQTLSAPDLLRLLSGNTLTGYNGKLLFSEWHAPDGRVLGHNGGIKNQNSCWTLRGDAVCYYYPQHRQSGQNARTEFCWHLESASPTAYRLRAVGKPISGLAWITPGNSRDHSDEGKAWICDTLMSRRNPGGAEVADATARSETAQH
ncbi:hypothetical protein [Enterovirga rhinocerotis]|uniref:DUF995 domain-containing protein n=1 Tax=Enterovirga rhinocerotis TaxID=1339210 RepID=A0A4R7CC55_9HYPH|nr:hypothetical protein [Enterovirga rhinocerotis]TDR94367.1 hypothetical protein EV668_1653 [Enterovirga rhinocerotis]